MSEPYQSRVFTFVSKRANQLKDSCAKGLRHLKVAVVWSGQIFLSPLHWLAQATKIFQPQLPPPRAQPLLPQPVSDINIEQALELVEVAGYPILLAPPERLRHQSGSTKEITQTGVATLVDCSEIELTHASDLTIDRSASDATLWYLGRSNNDITTAPEITYTHSRQITPPKPIIRGLSSLLGDRQLVLVTTENEILDILTIAQQQELRRRIGLDIALAWHQWQTSKLASDLDAKKFSASEKLSLTSENNRVRELPSQNLFKRLTSWFKTKPKSPTSQLVQPENIRSDRQKDRDRLPPVQYAFTPQPLRLDRFLDLPQLPPIHEADRVIERDNSLGEIFAKLQPDWFKQLWSYYREYVYIPAPTDSTILYQPPQEFELIPIDSTPSKIFSNQISPAEPQIDRDETTRNLQESAKLAKKVWQNLEYQPDWIEAISEEIGYSQTPFARFLAWLDRIVLAIENWAIELWNKIVNSRSAN